MKGILETLHFFESVFAGHKMNKLFILLLWQVLPLSEKKPRLYTEVNVDGTVNLLNLSVQHFVSRFVFGSLFISLR